MTAASSLYKGHRYPGEIIAHCVWLYHRFPLSFREVKGAGAGTRAGPRILLAKGSRSLPQLIPEGVGTVKTALSSLQG